MSNSYDKKGNYIGQTDSNGNHWDKDGGYAGKTDSNGNHWDKDGNYTGKTDSNGNHWDKDRNYIGKTDSNGNSWDRGGSYSGKNNRGGGDGGSSSGSGGGLEILLAIIWLATAAIGIGIVASPIIAPILLTTVENARKKSDFAYVKKWESWGSIASVIAVLVVLVAAGAMGFVIATSISGFTASSTSPLLTNFLYIVAIIVGIISFALLFIAGISPTALIYLKNKEAYFLSTGEVVKAKNLQQYSSVIKTTAITTVILTVAIFIIIPLASATTRWVSTKIQASVFPPSTTVQNSPIITESTKVVLTSTPTSIPTKEITGIVPTSGLPPTQVFTTTLSPSLSNVSIPNMSNFSACIEPCNGSNLTSNFPEAITKLYVEWDYENIPYGARYIRKWTMDEREWIRYDCIWSGNENGRDSVKLTEPKGLHSGTWELTISVNDEVLLREQINVSGNWDYWDPAGTLNSCYGTTD